MRIVSILLILLLPLIALSQTSVSGTIVDENGIPLIAVNIIEFPFDEDNPVGTVSDFDGKFALTTNKDSLQISYIGYETVTISIADVQNDATIRMEQTGDLIACPTIIAYNHMSEAQSGKKIAITDLQNYNPTIITEQLNTIPGVFMQSAGINTNRLTIRGIGSRSPFATSQVKTFYNSIPLHDGAGESAIEDFGIPAATALEVLKGPTGYQREAGLGGAIVFENAPSFVNKFSLENQTTVGAWGLVDSKTNFNWAESKGRHYNALKVNHNHTSSDGFRDNNELERNNLSLVYNLSARRHKLEILANRVDLRAQIPGALDSAGFAENPSEAAFIWKDARGNEDYAKTLLGVTHEYTSQQNYKWQTTLFSNTFRSSELRPFNTIDENINTVGARLQLTKSFSTSTFFGEGVFGVAGKQEQYDFELFETNVDQKGSLLSIGANNRRFVEAYGGLRLSFDSPWRLYLGLNASQNSFSIDPDLAGDTGIFLAPELTIERTSKSYSSKSYLKFSRGRNIANPTETLLPNGNVNEQLIPESGYNAEVGAKGLLFYKLTYRAALYHMWLQDIYVTRFQDDISFLENGGSANHLGLETDLSYKFADEDYFSMRAEASLAINAYSFGQFVSGSSDFTNNDVTGVPRETAHFAVFANSYHFFGNCRIQHVGRIPITDANTVYNDAYQVVNARIGVKFEELQHWKFRLAVEANNILDAEYASMVSVNAMGFGRAPRYYYAGLPRHLNVILSVAYDM